MSIASKTESLILQRFAIVGQSEAGRATGIDNTHLSRFASNDRGLNLNQLGPVLEALGLAIIETEGDVVTIPAKEYDALRYLVKQRL